MHNNGNCSDPCEKDPNFECLRVRSTRKHSKFGNFLTMAEQLQEIKDMDPRGLHLIFGSILLIVILAALC